MGGWGTGARAGEAASSSSSSSYARSGEVGGSTPSRRRRHSSAPHTWLPRHGAFTPRVLAAAACRCCWFPLVWPPAAHAAGLPIAAGCWGPSPVSRPSLLPPGNTTRHTCTRVGHLRAQRGRSVAAWFGGVGGWIAGWSRGRLWVPVVPACVCLIEGWCRGGPLPRVSERGGWRTHKERPNAPTRAGRPKRAKGRFRWSITVPGWRIHRSVDRGLDRSTTRGPKGAKSSKRC